eukprot:7076684-Pyramimonas_sp.AAC.1
MATVALGRLQVAAVSPLMGALFSWARRLGVQWTWTSEPSPSRCKWHRTIGYSPRHVWQLSLLCAPVPAASIRHNTEFAHVEVLSGRGSEYYPFTVHGHPHDVSSTHVGIGANLSVPAPCLLRDGEWLGKAFDLPDTGNPLALFPHVLMKNVSVRVGFKSAYCAPPAETVRPRASSPSP